jgi:protein gp37
MQTQDRFAAEAALFEAMMPDLMKTSADKWFVAWNGELKAVVDTLHDAYEIVTTQPESVDVMVKQIAKEKIMRLPSLLIAG